MLPDFEGIPVSYETINQYNGSFSPSTVHCRDTRLQRYFRKYLLQKAMSVYKWNLPETWDKDYFLYTLYLCGFLAVTDTPDYGVIPQYATLSGYNVFYRPTTALITNPLFGTLNRQIDVDCTIIKIQPSYSSIMDIINYYADMLALCSQSISINLINTHTATIFPASDKATAETVKKMYDKVASGEPAVFVGKKMFDDMGNPIWQPFEKDVKNLYISDMILSDMRKIENQFATEIGLPNANTDKRERMITDEVNANNVETASRPELWLQTLQAGCEKTRSMFGVDVSVDWNVNPFEEVANNAIVDTRAI